MRIGERSGATVIRVAACLCMLLPLPASLSSQQPKTCTGFEVSEPLALKDAKGRPIYVERPSIVKSGRKILLFNNATALWQKENVFADTVGLLEEFKAGRFVDLDTLAGAILDGNGIATTFGKPPGWKKLMGMVASSDAHEGAWAAWLAAPDSTKAPTELWTGHFREGKWDEVHRIYEGIFINKYSLSMSDADSQGEPVMSMSAQTGLNVTDPRGIGIFKRVRGTWQQRWIHAGWFTPAWSEIARLSDR